MLKKTRKELGQALVEYGLVLPIFIVLVLGILELSWIGYQKAMLEHKFRRVSLEIRLDTYEQERVLRSGYDLYLPQDRARYIIKEQILNTDDSIIIGGIDPNNIRVVNPMVNIYPGERRFKYQTPPGYESREFQVSDNRVAMVTIEIGGDILYRIPNLTPISRLIFGEDGLEIRKNIYKIKRGLTKTI